METTGGIPLGAMIFMGAFTCAALWCCYLAWKGMTADSPPFMQGWGGPEQEKHQRVS